MAEQKWNEYTFGGSGLTLHGLSPVVLSSLNFMPQTSWTRIIPETRPVIDLSAGKPPGQPFQKSIRLGTAG